MSAGPGKLQRAVFDVLVGVGRPLKTAELFDELVAFGNVKAKARKVDLGKIVRACHGLCERGLLQMEYVPDGPVRKTCEWAVKR
jgi:hypothetical protein